MNATTVAVDVAKNVFELALADAQWRIVGSARLTRGQFERWFDNRDVSRVVMEACGSRILGRTRSHGIEGRLFRRSMCAPIELHPTMRRCSALWRRRAPAT